MAANYYYGFGHGASPFSLSSGSYQGGGGGGGYSTTSPGSRTSQQPYNETHSQGQYGGAFANQAESSASPYGDSKPYFMSSSQNTSLPSYASSSSPDDAASRYGQDLNHPSSRYLSHARPLSSGHSSFQNSVGTSKPSYTGSTYSKASSDWQSVGTAGSQSGQTQTDEAKVMDSGFDQSSLKPSSYYHLLTTGSTSSPGGGTCTGNRRLFPFGQRMRPRQPPKPSQLHYCEVCRISCAGAQTYLEHLEGKNHKKKELQMKTELTSTSVKSLSSSSGGYGQRQLHCQLCDVACTGADTYAAHIRGAKHQKVLNLHTKLGKPIPDAATAAENMKGSVVTTTTSGAKKVIIPVKINFVAGSQLNTTGKEDEVENIEKAEDKSEPSATNDETEETDIQDDSDVQPVGLEYIEESRNETGSAVSFHCKLCNCNFTDPLAKVMHTKGRRHRLNYKQKVDPSLEVSMKPSPFMKHRQMNRQAIKMRRNVPSGNYGNYGNYWNRSYYDDIYRQEVEELRFEKEMLQWQLNHALERSYDNRLLVPTASYPAMQTGSLLLQNVDTLDDRYVTAKHGCIYPNEQDLAAVQMTVSDCEKALKSVSDIFASATSAEQQQQQNLVEVNEDKTETKEISSGAGVATGGGASRELKGVMRVGALSKGLLLHGNLNVELVVLCNEWPTQRLLAKVLEEFTRQIETAAPNKYAISLTNEDGHIRVSNVEEPKTTCVVMLTSLAVKAGSNEISEEDFDRLDRSTCLQSLASLRRAKWFQAKASSVSTCVVLVRIMKDLCNRIPTWSPFSEWSLELITQKCLISAEQQMNPGSGLRRILECISSGLLLTGGPGLYDPCEKEATDVFSFLTRQEREDITNSAQHALRLLALGQINKVLGMELLPSIYGQGHCRKRQRPENLAGGQGDNATAGGLRPN